MSPSTGLFGHEKRVPSSPLNSEVLNIFCSGKASRLINMLGFLLPFKVRLVDLISSHGLPFGESFQSPHITGN